MASIPSITEAKTELQNAIKLLDDLDTSAMSGFATNYDTILNNLSGEYSDSLINSINIIRGSLAETVTQSVVRGVLSPALENFMLAINEPVGGFEDNADRLIEYMQDNAETFNAAQHTHGSPTAVSGNTGTGLVYRLALSKYGHELQAVHAETKTFECIIDQTTGNEYQEVFRVSGQRRLRDDIEIQGSGIDTNLTVSNADNSTQIILNPTFTVGSGTPAAGSPITPSSTTDISNWTLTTAANARLDADTVFRGSPSRTTPVSLRFTDNNTITQSIKTRAPSLDPDVPILIEYALYRESNCDGNFISTMGLSALATSMSGLSNGAWTVKAHALDSSRYLDQFNTTDAAFSFQLSSRTTGSVYIAAPIVVPFTFVDGEWWAITPGQTSFLRGDKFTAATTYGTRAKIIYWLEFRSGLNQGGRAYAFPTATSGETITDPS